MNTARPSPHHHPHRPILLLPVTLLLAIISILSPLLCAQRAMLHTRAANSIAINGAVERGQLPLSQTLTLTLHLRPSPAQASALDQLLVAQTDRDSPAYHHWITPAQFADQFGPTPDQLATLTQYLQSQGLTLAALSPAHSRLNVTGTADQVQRTFDVKLRRFNVNGTPYFANANDPSSPAEVADLIGSISGLDNLPQPASARMFMAGSAETSTGPKVRSFLLEPSSPTEEAPQTDSLTNIADAIDANTLPILNLTTKACSSDLTPVEVDSYRALFRQANAQGITVLSTSSCASATSPGFPASLAEVTSLSIASDGLTLPTAGIEARPAWQAAPGLPPDALRHEPDLTTTSSADFAMAIATLNQQTGSRLGNINATLYSLAKLPGLFTQPDALPGVPPGGDWEPATGLGLIDLKTLIKVYPRGTNVTTTGLQASTYDTDYGNPISLTAQVNTNVYGTSPPSGTVTFTATPQGIIGSLPIDSAGRATLSNLVLPAGTYTVTASYTGDDLYSSSSSASNPVKTIITIHIVNAKLAATLSPTVNVPYGATATVTATVTLPTAAAAPSGPVSAQIQGITGALYTATLSPNPGANSSTANITLSIPSPGKYTVEVACQGSANFQCQTPVLIPLTTVKGYTNTTVSVSPAAPQAGQPVSLTATVVNSGNGNATYTYGGSISFFDSGKLIATAPVATNQATATTVLSGLRSHNLTAVYTGDANWNTSTSGAVAVLPTILSDTLTLSTNVTGQSSLAGVDIVFTGTISTTVTYQSGPTGTLTFLDTFNNSVVQLGNPSAIVANGPYASIGILRTTGLQPGVHRIYAQYSGDDSYAPSISPVITLALSDFTVIMTPSTLTLSQGKSAQVTALIGASGGFTGNVSLGCTPPGNSEATCNISPSSVAPGQTATVTVTTTAPRSTASHARSVHAGSSSSRQAGAPAGFSSATGVALATLLLFLVPGRRRTIPSLLLVLLAVSLTANLGCGVGSTAANAPSNGPNPSDPGTPLGTQNYTITAAGSDGINVVRHTFQYQVTVQ